MTTTWVDTETSAIPPHSTWAALDDMALLKVKAALMNRLYIAGANQMYAIPLRHGIAEIEAILMDRLNKPAGS
jgi:hypothetical protein